VDAERAKRPIGPLSDLFNRHIFTNPPYDSADMKSTMDVTSISGASAFQQQTVANNVQSSVAAKVMDSQRTQGADVLKMLEAASPQPSSSNPNGSLDVHA
jgi:hypothetical protein